MKVIRLLENIQRQNPRCKAVTINEDETARRDYDTIFTLSFIVNTLLFLFNNNVLTSFPFLWLTQRIRLVTISFLYFSP